MIGDPPTINLVIGFGGVFVLGLIGILVHWLIGRRERAKAQDSARRLKNA